MTNIKKLHFHIISQSLLKTSGKSRIVSPISPFLKGFLGLPGKTYVETYVPVCLAISSFRKTQEDVLSPTAWLQATIKINYHTEVWPEEASEAPICFSTKIRIITSWLFFLLVCSFCQNGK